MLLISSCLVGDNVRYDGNNQLNDELLQLVEEGKAVKACPELLGGLNVPREPAEIIGGDGRDVWTGSARVMTINGRDVTAAYKKGAVQTLEFCRQHQIDEVILKENSPSCGSRMIYNGQFNGTKKAGVGVTTALLEQHHIKVWNELTDRTV